MLHSLSPIVVSCVVVAWPWSAALAQPRSMRQDSTINNLEHAAGTVLSAPGTLGRVRTVGTGARHMILIAGMGFGDGTWEEFMQPYRESHTMYAVTLPGFGGTSPLPMPTGPTRYSATPWIRSAVTAVQGLMEREGLQRVTLVAQWAIATQVALRVALESPQLVERVLLVSGAPREFFVQTPAMINRTLDQRKQQADAMAQRWFKTVTRTTWDDNNFMSYDYAINPRRGLALWREAATPSVPVWVQYLLEFYASDITRDLGALQVPVLALLPGFDDAQVYVDDPKNNYMKSLAIDAWQGVAERTPNLRLKTIPQSRLFPQYDQPAALHQAAREFFGLPR
jgi:pimeloyl-ACP methyl ester carboxylesterase